MIDAPWPLLPKQPATTCVAGETAPNRWSAANPGGALSVEPAPPFDPKGKTFLEAIIARHRRRARFDPRTFVYGQDVGGPTATHFFLLKPSPQGYGDAIINSVLAEGAVLGVAIGAALAGRRPIAESVNDFVATGFNQLVNSAAKIRYRWRGEVPMVVRLPWGGRGTPARITVKTRRRGFIARLV